MATQRITVTIEHETRKALLISDGSRKGWIQKRWLAEDGTVAVKTFEKAATRFTEAEAAKQEAKEWRETVHQIVVKRETEKAVAIDAVFYGCNSEHWFDRLFWIPKSLLKDGCCPGWFLLKKLREVGEQLYERVGDNYMLESIGIEDAEHLTGQFVR